MPSFVQGIPVRLAIALCLVTLCAGPLGAQAPARPASQPAPATSVPAEPVEVVAPPDYVIGPEDVLSIVVWREKDLSADVTVRPDGKVSLPLLNDVQAAGLSPEQFRQQLTTAAAKFVADPSVTVIVKAINSRKVYIMGEIARPGPYPLTGPVTVLQLIALSGGLTQFADEKGIGVMRIENGRPLRLPFNYHDVARGRKIEQNVLLRPGDTIIVP